MSGIEVAVVWVLLIAAVIAAGRRMAKLRGRHREDERPGYITVRRTPPGNNGYPTYYTYEMRRANRQRRA